MMMIVALAIAATSYNPHATFDLKVQEVALRKNQAGRMLMARIYQPEGPGPFPVVLDLHGGAWNAKNRTAEEPMDRALASSGLLVVAIDMTLAPEAPYPAAIQDANYAVRWLKTNAKQWNGDGSRVGVYGSSSGGQVAELLAMRPHDPRYNAIPLPGGATVDATVAFVAMRSPVSNPLARYENAVAMKREPMMNNHKTFFVPWEAIHESNPQEILERHEKITFVPFLIMQGALDDNVRPAVQEKFVATYKAAGGNVQFHVFEDSEHEWVARPGRRTDEAREMVKGFIARQVNVRKTLDIYVVDVEGGNATLFVSPSGQSVLIDTGNGGPAAQRDGERILAAARDAGLTQIDHLITTHYHGDHFGAMEYVSSRLPIRHFIDHGELVEARSPANAFVTDGYPKLYAAATHTVAKPGDKLTVAGLDWRIVESAGQHITTALPGAGKPNPTCADYTPGMPDPSENAQSVGSIVTFGRFRVAHLGDLTWNKEYELMCPNNPLGTVDLFIVSHHGQAISNSPQLVHALRPRVMVMNNGTRKGGQPDAMKVLHSSPGLEDLWQMHFSLLSGQEYTVPGMFIANTTDDNPSTLPVAPLAAPAPGPNAAPPPAHNGAAYWIKISASDDGTFTVTNARNSFSKTYKKS